MFNKTVAFDLDDVICYRTSDLGPVDKYKSCKPYLEMIDIVNHCYENGCKIVF